MDYEKYKAIIMSNYKVVIIALLIVISIIIYIVIINPNQDYEVISSMENNIQESTEEVQKVDKRFIKVHLDGEVVNPGVYEVEENSRLQDAIKLAGGVTQNASLKNINLAVFVKDEEKYYIPSIEDEENNEFSYTQNGNKNGKININTANIEELKKINGIGEGLASRILEYRKDRGRFNTIEDLKNVSGIGDKKFESLKDEITV